MRKTTGHPSLLNRRRADLPGVGLLPQRERERERERVAEAAVFSADFSITAGYSIHHVEYPLLLFGERQFTVMFSSIF